MKRFLAFHGSKYEPLGGMDDFVGDYSAEDEAIKAIIDKNNKEYKDYEGYLKDRWEYSWAHIYDTKNRIIVWTEQ